MMATLLEKLAPKGWSPKPGSAEFVPCARYYAAMDFLMYLTEDCAYVEDRIDGRLTLLWHPDEKRAVGIRLKGFRAVYEGLKRILQSEELDFETRLPFLKLVTAVQFALEKDGLGERLTEDAHQQRVSEGYERARQVVRDERVAFKQLDSELALAA